MISLLVLLASTVTNAEARDYAVDVPGVLAPVSIRQVGKRVTVSWPKTQTGSILYSTEKPIRFGKNTCAMIRQDVEIMDSTFHRRKAASLGNSIALTWQLLPAAPQSKALNDALEAKTGARIESGLELTNYPNLTALNFTFTWSENAIGKLIGTEEIEALITDEAKARMSAISSTGNAQFQTNRKDLMCDLIHGDLEVSVTLDGITRSSRHRSWISGREVYAASQALRKSFPHGSDDLTHEDRLFLNAYHMTQSLPESAKRGLVGQGPIPLITLFWSMVDNQELTPKALTRTQAKAVARSLDKVTITEEPYTALSLMGSILPRGEN